MRRSLAAIAGVALVLVAVGASAQRQGSASSSSARDLAPIDLTGYWVSYVTENWRYRMVTPAKGEYRRIPASPAALPIINAWDPVADQRAGNQCKSYGAAAIMSVPGRLHITWQDADTLRIDTDAGTQTRLFRFTAPAPGGKSASATRPTWQGESNARWERVAAPDTGGSLRVVTSNLRAGYLRKNGVPYSANAVVTEYYNVLSEPSGDTWLIVTNTVDDPEFLTQPFVTSSHFKKLSDGSSWKPVACTAR